MCARHVVLEVGHVGGAVVPVDRHEVHRAAHAEGEEGFQPWETGSSVGDDWSAEEEGACVGHHVLFVRCDCSCWCHTWAILSVCVLAKIEVKAEGSAYMLGLDNIRLAH